MRSEVRTIEPLTWLRQALPSEHGFWVMLGGALLSALLRAGASAVTVAAAVTTAIVVVIPAGALHRGVRRSELAQLSATLLLSLAAVPAEIAGGLSIPSVAAAGLARAVVFVASALVVRAAFARTARGGIRRNQLLHVVSVAIATGGAMAFYALGHGREASACAMAAALCMVLMYQRPTVKQLKPLGFALSGLVLASAVALAL